MNHIIKIGQLLSENNLNNIKSYILLNNVQINEYNEGCFDLLIQTIEKNTSDDILRYILSFYKNINFESINSKIPLFVAIEKNHFKQADILISYHADINNINKNKDNIITHLFNKNLLNKKNLSYILNKNINVNFKNRHGVRIVESLIRKKEYALLKLIFTARVFQNETILRLISAHKYNIVMTKQQLRDYIEDVKSKIEITKSMFINAIKNTDENILNLLLENEPHDYIFDPTNGYNLLNEAVERSNFPMVKILLKNGVHIDERNFKNSTPLIISSENGDKEIVEYLVEHGAQVNVSNSEGETPLKVAYSKWNIGIVKYLIEHGANINDSTQTGKTLLVLAIEENQIEMIQYFLQHPTLEIDFEDDLHWTALMYAAEQGNVQIIQQLIQHGANVNHCDNSGDTPFLVAAEYGHEDAVKFFLESTKTDINKKNNKGWTALMLASKSGHIPVIEYFIKMGANPKLRNTKGDSPLFVSVYYNHLPLVQYFLQNHSNVLSVNEKKKNGNDLLIFAALNGNLEMVQYLIKQGICLSTLDYRKNNALIQASYLGHLNIVHYLVEKGMNPLQKDNHGMSALLYAAKNGHQAIVEYLIEKVKVDINEVNDNGDTALILATQWKRIDVFMYLVEQGANVNHQNHEGNSALIIATKKKSFDLVQYLVEHWR